MDMAKVDGNQAVQLKLTDEDGTAVKMETVDEGKDVESATKEG